jgi:hypothetical protein
MNRPRNIIWIDDNPARQSTATDLSSRFVNVRGKDLAPELTKLLDGLQPRLVVIDHVLDKATGSHPLFLKGSTIAEAIKEKWPSCPVVGVTNADNLKGIDQRTREAYDALFPFHEFSRYFDRIRRIGRGFDLAARTGRDIQKLIKLLKPPSEDKKRLFEVLTDDLKSKPQDRSVASRIFRWVEHLMDRPGLLLDALWSATLLGLNESGFAKVLHIFEKAKYRGVFARPDDHRWWSSALSERLYKRCKPEAGDLSWHVGRRLPGIRKEHFSSCYYCGKEFPETVAFLDEASDEQRAMHLKCTVLHPRYARELYFEDVRIMRGE